MVKVTYMENGEKVERIFPDEKTAKEFKVELTSRGIKGKWEW